MGAGLAVALWLLAPPLAPAPDAAFLEAARKIRRVGDEDDAAYAKLEHLCDRIGHRLSGSPTLDAAVTWAAEVLRADGHEAVRTDAVQVPHWVRGPISAQVVAPVRRELAAIALGGSGATPAGGLEAEVVRAGSLEELGKLGGKVRGKIALLDGPMGTHGSSFDRYSEVGPMRGAGPAQAARQGAIAVLVRSLTQRSLRTPHTGGTRFGTQAPIPAAALATEDADLLARLGRRGPVRVRLSLAAHKLPDATSANVIAELRGRERPDEIVLLGAHLDSWDVGQGAHDDGAGTVMVMQALTILRKAHLRPRRTVRVVLFTNEENGLRGAEAYTRDHATELGQHVAAIESDAGGYAPSAFTVEGAAVEALAAYLPLFAGTGLSRIVAGKGGSDISALEPAKVPTFGYLTDETHYFDIHHTQADTLDKVRPDDVRRGATVLAILAYVLAELPGRLGR